jgi:NAD(P)H-dependent FMN reductase
MNVLAISGSLRQASINSAFCRAAARLARPPLRVSVFPGLGLLPLFNPDLEACPPDAVQELRSAVTRADALIIASPEYAHGIPGALKNALDWLVSHEGTVHKPIALVNTSPRAHHAADALREVLQTMSTRLIPQASIGIALLGACVTEEAMLATPQVRQAIEASLTALAAFLAGQDGAGAHFPLA